MSVGRAVAGCAAVLLLVPGLCSVWVGFISLSGHEVGLAIGLLALGACILGFAAYLIKISREPEDWIKRQKE